MVLTHHGEIVLLHDDGPRGFWKLAKIERLITGKDERVRGAVIQVPATNGQTTVLQHPLQLFYPLEITQRMSSTVDTPPSLTVMLSPLMRIP